MKDIPKRMIIIVVLSLVCLFALQPGLSPAFAKEATSANNTKPFTPATLSVTWANCYNEAYNIDVYVPSAKFCFITHNPPAYGYLSVAISNVNTISFFGSGQMWIEYSQDGQLQHCSLSDIVSTYSWGSGNTNVELTQLSYGSTHGFPPC